MIEPCGFKKEPWSWKQWPPLIFDLLSHFYAIGILRKWNISLVFSTSSGDDFYGWRRRQEIGKLLCWKWNHGNSQSQGSANDLDQSYSLGKKRLNSIEMLERLWDHALSPDKSSEKIYRSWRSWNIRFFYQRKISMCSTLGGKCLRKIHRRVSLTIIPSWNRFHKTFIPSMGDDHTIIKFSEVVTEHTIRVIGRRSKTEK